MIHPESTLRMMRSLAALLLRMTAVAMVPVLRHWAVRALIPLQRL